MTLRESESSERFGIQSVEVAAEILGAMTGAAAPLALKDLAKAAGMPAGKVHRYLVSLVRTGLAVQETDGRYAIGPNAIGLGLAGLRSISPVKVAPEFLRALRDKTGETSALMLWNERGPIVVDIEESPRPIFMNIRAGSLLPLTGSAAGRAFAAFLPDDTQVRLDSRACTLREAFGADWSEIVEDVRQRGYASVKGVLVPGIAAMAAPVFDHRGQMAAALTFLAREQDISGKKAGKAARILIDSAKLFSQRLGHNTAPQT